MDLPTEFAKHLIETNQADPVGKSEPVTKVESAEVKAPEQAAITEAPKPKRFALKGKKKKEA